MQKLFSMFPGGAPGLALLLLRLFVGAVLVFHAAGSVPPLPVIVAGALVLCALAIVVGFMTPIAAILVALIEVIGLSGHLVEIALPSFAPIVIAIALALLGPGAYSLDAKVFGRRLMQFGPDAKDVGGAIDR